MTNSYFLLEDYSGKKYKFLSYDCCQSAGTNLMTLNPIEFIKIPEINNDILENKDIIREYIALVSEFIGITLEEVDIPNRDNIIDLQADIKELPEEAYQNRFIAFKIGPYFSNKHFVAMHTLVRYLWYGHEGYHQIVFSVIKLRRECPTLEIETVFAIAHSFQNKTVRALIGRRTIDSLGFIYFKSKDKYLKEFHKETNFNTIFDSYEIVVIPTIVIKGTFFKDSEIVIDTKQFISFLTDLSDNTATSIRVLNLVINMYKDYNFIHNIIDDLVSSKKIGDNKFILFNIRCNETGFVNAECTLQNMITGKTESKNIKSIKELEKYLNNFKRI